MLLLERIGDDGVWEALVRPSRRVRVGERLGPVRLSESRGGGRWLVEVHGEPGGEMPLPPYIHEALAEPERYQTVYGEVEGSAAAPTAGLHFTPELVELLAPVRVTLHVGLDTFRPVTESSLEAHALHGERYSVEPTAWERIAAAERVLAVGTTTVRVLETVARSGELVGRTTLFITPGFRFMRVDALLTNFHLPRSTLLALVMAFVGVDDDTRDLSRGGGGALSVLLVRRRDARAVRVMAVRLSCRSRCVLSTVSCSTRALVGDTLTAGGGAGWPRKRGGSGRLRRT